MARGKASVDASELEKLEWPYGWGAGGGGAGGGRGGGRGVGMARGKASVDASELEKLEWPYGWPPPWRSERLLGHEAAEKTMLAAHESGRLDHAWLMGGT